MSLKIWLPLNGSNANQGISGTTMSGGPNSWSAEGKIGKCAVFNNNTANVIYSTDKSYNYTTEDFSWCMWLKKNYASKTAISMYAFTVGRADAGGYGYGLYVSSATAVTFRFGNSAWEVSMADNEWHHLAFTRSGTEIKMYMDGVLSKSATFSGTLPTYSDGNGLGVGCFHYTGNIYPLIGSVNDFRIYDHCLSAKEVYQISLGLCLHFKMNNEYEIGLKNLYTGNAAHGCNASGSFSRTKLADEDGYNYKLSYTGTGSNSWKSIDFSPFTYDKFKANTKYTWSCKIRIHTWTADNLHFRNAIAGNDYTNGYTVVANASKEKEVWTEYSRTLTLKDGMKIGSNVYYITKEGAEAAGSTLMMTPRVEFYTGGCATSGTVYNFDFDLKDIQLIESDEFPGYIDNDLTRGMADSSGIHPSSTVSGALQITNTSPRYNKATKFTDSSYIQFSLPQQMTEATYSYWIKPSTTGYKAICYAKGSPTCSKTPWLSANTEGFGMWMYIAGVSPNYHKYGSALSTAWHHCAWVFDNGKSAWYLDGAHVGTDVTWTDFTALANTTDITIGDSYTGTSWSGTPMTDPISDFRVYATAMSAADIKALYSVGASMDNTGRLFCGELDETGSNASAQKNTVFISEGIYEPGGYAFINDSNKPTGKANYHGLSYSYTPAADAVNACLAGAAIDFTNAAAIKYRVELDITYSGFDSSSTAGTFGLWFQGSVRKKADSSWVWSSNPIASTLNTLGTGGKITSIVTSGNSKKHMSISADLSTWVETYDYASLGFRADYSNGKGTITMSNVRIYPERDYKDKTCSINSDGTVSTKELNEALF